MTIKEQLIADMKDAMRARDSVKLNTIRFIMSEIKNYEIDNDEQDDAGVQKVVASQVKKMNDAIKEFAAADRQDLVDEEKAKVEVLSVYLPEQLSDDQLKKIVQEVIDQEGSDNRGVLMGAIMKKVAGQADGGRVNAMIQELLA